MQCIAWRCDKNGALGFLMNDLNLQDNALLKEASFINGEWVKGNDTFEVRNPATNDVIAQIYNASLSQAEDSLDVAKEALRDWSAMSANERAYILRRWFSLMLEHQDDLARLLTLEQGKPLSEAKGEIAYGASYLEWFAEEGKRVYGDTIPAPSSDKRIIVIKQPVGVVTSITPWNFPNAMIARKAAAALAAGCTFVSRPSELTPLSALAMAELAGRAGIPAGVFNVVTRKNPQEIGELFTQHPKVAKFTFTGSTAVGKKLIAQCASGVKKVSMELGGNAPFIVFEDADIDAAVKGAVISKYRNAGQTCVCTNRIFVQRSVLDAFNTKYQNAVKQLTVGNGLDENVVIGPMISQSAAQKVAELIQRSVAEGAVIELGGNTSGENGNFFEPTILSNVTNNMAVAKNEIFGPLSAIIAFDTEEEAIYMANDTEYGLAAYFYSRDIGRVWRVSEKLAFGMVGINEGIISNAAAPFGGIKASGYGREGSKYGLDDYLETKYLCMGGI